MVSVSNRRLLVLCDWQALCAGREPTRQSENGSQLRSQMSDADVEHILGINVRSCAPRYRRTLSFLSHHTSLPKVSSYWSKAIIFVEECHISRLYILHTI